MGNPFSTPMVNYSWRHRIYEANKKSTVFGLLSVVSLQVTWLKEHHGKFFQYIKNRVPPYRNFSIPGAVIDVSKISFLFGLMSRIMVAKF